VKRRLSIVFLILALMSVGSAKDLPLPPRSANALKGTDFAQSLTAMDLVARDAAIKEEVLRGNVPGFWRAFSEVTVTQNINGDEHTLSYHVAPEYLAIGSDADYFLASITPGTAQQIADALNCALPTCKMVNDIYSTAKVKLEPRAIPPNPAMTTVPYFVEHNLMVRKLRAETLARFPLGALVGGHKKDVVITPRLASARGKVAIYGWHQAEGMIIQPLYLGHTAAWVDYSHGIRLVQKDMMLDGQPTTYQTILAHPSLSALLSDEGAIASPRYLIEARSPISDVAKGTNSFGEVFESMTFDPGVRVVLNRPTLLDTNKPVRLIFYALPNGNTIEQTIGHKLKEGDDWHFDIQHIGAQTRWLRERETNVNIVVAYFESAEKSWPTWRKKNDAENKRIVSMVDAVRARFVQYSPKLVLTGHSGGGSFTFGYLNGVEHIAADVERIAFLDSNYAYDAAAKHDEKLLEWLKAGDNRYLCVLAYHDSIALLNGKTFVSENGGTWGRSLAMVKDFGAKLEWNTEADAEWQRYSALDGRVKFFLKENPTKAVLHTRQVEWNGFIHAMLTGTPAEGKDYTYMGTRAYGRWILAE
jgi:hypothetical protein